MVRTALVGCGKHMRTTLIPYLQRLDGYEVAVTVDIDEAAARIVQQVSRAKNWAAKIEDIDLDNIDVAIVALPPKAAYQVTSYLVNHRKICFVEKPPASTSKEIEDLVQRASAMEVPVQVGFNFRFAEAMVAFHNCAADYRSDPCVMSIEFRSKHPSGPEWELDDPVEAWLYHNGVHALDLLRWMVGEIREVNAYITRTSEAKFTIVTFMKHANNSISTLKLGTMTEKFDLRAELFTPDVCQFYLPNLGEVVMQLRHGKVTGEVIYRTNNLDSGWGRAGYGPELQYFLDNYQQVRACSPSLLDALKASQLCDAIFHSLRTGTTCTLP